MVGLWYLFVRSLLGLESTKTPKSPLYKGNSAKLTVGLARKGYLFRNKERLLADTADLPADTSSL